MQELSCNQILALLTFFIENRLNPKLMQSVEFHLNICPNCREKYLNLRKIFNNYQDIKDKITESEEQENISYKEKQYIDFKENLSAYIDNELDDNENLRIRKIAIANINARLDLEETLCIRELLLESFERMKNNLKTDFSEITVNKLYNNNEKSIKLSYIKVISIILLITIISIITWVNIINLHLV